MCASCLLYVYLTLSSGKLPIDISVFTWGGWHPSKGMYNPYIIYRDAANMVTLMSGRRHTYIILTTNKLLW